MRGRKSLPISYLSKEELVSAHDPPDVLSFFLDMFDCVIGQLSD